jgi:hypothetical protein
MKSILIVLVIVAACVGGYRWGRVWSLATYPVQESARSNPSPSLFVRGMDEGYAQPTQVSSDSTRPHSPSPTFI